MREKTRWLSGVRDAAAAGGGASFCAASHSCISADAEPPPGCKPDPSPAGSPPPCSSALVTKALRDRLCSPATLSDATRPCAGDSAQWPAAGALLMAGPGIVPEETSRDSALRTTRALG